MLKVNAGNLTPIVWDDSINLSAGAWVAAPSPQGSAIFVAVISIGRERGTGENAGNAPPRAMDRIGGPGMRRFSSTTAIFSLSIMAGRW